MNFKNKTLTFYGMNMLLIILIIIPKDFSMLFNIVPVRLLAMAILALLFIWDYFRGNIKLRKMNIRWYIIIYVVFLLLTIPSLFFTKNLVTSVYTFVKFASFGLMFFIFAKTDMEKGDYSTLLKMLLIAASLVVLYGIIQYIFRINLNMTAVHKYYIRGRVTSTFFNPIYFGIFANLVFFYSIYAFREKLVTGKRSFLLLLIPLLLFIGLIFTFTRSAILIFAVSLAANMIFNFRMLLNKYIIPVLLVCIALIFIIPGAFDVTKSSFKYGLQMVANEDYRDDFTIAIGPKAEQEEPELEIEEENNDASLKHRAEFAKIANRIAYDNPYTGVGFGTYFDFMRSEDFSETYSDYDDILAYPHSFYILLSAETGYPATLAYVFSLVVILVMLLITWFKSIRDRNHVYRLNTIAIIVFAGFIVTTYMSENAFYDTQISNLLFIMLGLSMNYINKKGYSASIKIKRKRDGKKV